MPGLTPHPGKMDGSRLVHIQLPIGIALVFSVHKDILHTLPLAGFHIIPVHHHISPSGSARAINKKQISISQQMELRIGHIFFLMAYHRFFISQNKGIGSNTAAIIQLMPVVVERKMKIAVAIYHHADNVMCILYVSFILRTVQSPLLGTQPAFAQHQPTVSVIIRNVLSVSMCHDGVVTEYGGVYRSAAEPFPYLYQPLGMSRKSDTA